MRAPAPRRVLFVGTYRESEISDRHPLHELIGDLRREGTLRRLELSGLAETEVGELVAELASAPASESFVHALAGETEGNPFFIEEVVRHIRDTSGALSEEVTLEEAGVPDGVREVTARRLRRLTEPTRAVLLVASVIGREFDYDVLAAVVSQGGDELVEALEEGVEARVLREVGHVGRYGFTHALVRATLYDSISQLRRARLHGRVGETLVRLRGGDLDPHLAMLAHHFAQAAPVERPDRAIDFALAAARRADRMLAWEEAAQHYRAALRARELAGAVDDHVRAELLLALGASEDRAGLEEEARETFQAAIRTARQLGDAVLLARGALGRRRAVVGAERAPTRGAWRCSTRRWRRCPDEDSPLRARLLARMSLELYYAGEPELRLSLSEEAMAIARRIDDPRTLATCLDARHYALWLPENVEERLEVAAELRRVAEQTGDPELELQGAGWTIIDLMELGDIDGVDIQIAAASKLAEALHRPIWLWWTSLFRGARAQLAGDFDEAERLDAGDAGDRPARAGRERAALLRAGDVQHPPRAGAAGGGRGRRARVHRALPGDPGVAQRRSALLLVELGRPGRGARGVRAGRRGRLRGVPARRELADRDHADGRGLRRARRRGARLGALPAARALRGPQRRRRPQRDLQRLAPRACSGILAAARGRVRAGRAPLRGGAGDARRDGRAAVARAHAGVLRGDAARAPRARATSSGRRRCSPTRSWSPTRWGWSCWPSARGGWCRRPRRRSARRRGELRR